MGMLLPLDLVLWMAVRKFHDHANQGTDVQSLNTKSPVIAEGNLTVTLSGLLLFSQSHPTSGSQALR